MDVEQLIQDSEQLIQWLDKNIDGLEIKSNLRTRLSAGCLDVALEHQKAIVLLVAHKRYGSAFALARIIFEAYIRGVWLQWCATDSEVERFKSGKIDKEFGTLVQEIETLDGFNEGVLSDVKKKSWNALNSFTHSGYSQAIRRNTENTIEPNYDAEEQIELLNFANAIGLFTGMAIAFTSGRNDLANSMLEKAKLFWKIEP